MRIEDSAFVFINMTPKPITMNKKVMQALGEDHWATLMKNDGCKEVIRNCRAGDVTVEEICLIALALNQSVIWVVDKLITE
jgi:hypothetical protein